MTTLDEQRVIRRLDEADRALDNAPEDISKADEDALWAEYHAAIEEYSEVVEKPAERRDKLDNINKIKAIQKEHGEKMKPWYPIITVAFLVLTVLYITGAIGSNHDSDQDNYRVDYHE
jgi:hypothetical protein